MNLYQRMAHLFLNHEFVSIEWLKDYPEIRRAHLIGGRYYVYPISPDRRSALLKGGELSPGTYLCGWKPITQKMQELYDAGPENNC